MNAELRLKYEKDFKKLKSQVKREGFRVIFDKYSNYINCPASSKYHLAIKGGLLIHSMNLYYKFKQRCLELKSDIEEESIIIISLLHDLCKVGAYIDNGIEFKYNHNHSKGHSILSINRIKEFMILTEQEENIIKYHMGTFGICDKYNPEYTIEELNEAIKQDYLIQVFASCDIECSQQEKYL